MKIFGFHIVHEDIVNLYAKKCAEVMALDKAINRKIAEYNELNVYYKELQKKYADLTAKSEQQHVTMQYRDDLIKEVKAKLEDLKSSNAELSERLEKEMSDNCELQNLYSEKCKECETLKTKIEIDNMTIDDLIQKKEAFAEKLKVYEQEGYVVVKEDHYEQLRTDAEKFREDRERHNASRRKRRAAKKVAQGKPD